MLRFEIKRYSIMLMFEIKRYIIMWDSAVFYLIIAAQLLDFELHQSENVIFIFGLKSEGFLIAIHADALLRNKIANLYFPIIKEYFLNEILNS